MKVGSNKKIPIKLVPDYSLKIEANFAWVLDAKSPDKKIIDSDNVDQVYSYATHPEIRSTYFALRGSSSKPEILTVQESFDLSAGSLAYPNPFNNELVIELAYPTKEVSYEIYNSQGALVESISLSDDKKITSYIKRQLPLLHF